VQALGAEVGARGGVGEADLRERRLLQRAQGGVPQTSWCRRTKKRGMRIEETYYFHSCTPDIPELKRPPLVESMPSRWVAAVAAVLNVSASLGQVRICE
jgi:hypothetical protein